MGRTVNYWLFSSLQPEKDNDFEFGERKAMLARLAFFGSGMPLYCPVNCLVLTKPRLDEIIVLSYYNTGTDVTKKS